MFSTISGAPYHLIYIVGHALSLRKANRWRGDTGFDIKGMWSLVSIEHIDGTQIMFPNESGTYIVLFDNDSTSYTCYL